MSADIAVGLHDVGAVQFGDFKLKDGTHSPVYVDLRLLVSDPPLLAAVARAYAGVMADLAFDRIAAVPYAGMPIGTARKSSVRLTYRSPWGSSASRAIGMPTRATTTSLLPLSAWSGASTSTLMSSRLSPTP